MDKAVQAHREHEKIAQRKRISGELVYLTTSLGRCRHTTLHADS
jgi:hypothetical protein